MPKVRIDASPMIEMFANMRKILEHNMAMLEAWAKVERKILSFAGPSRTWNCPVCKAYHASREHLTHYDHCPVLAMRAEAQALSGLIRETLEAALSGDVRPVRLETEPLDSEPTDPV